MNRSFTVGIVCMAICFGGAIARGDAGANAVIDKAVKALGADAQVAKLVGATWSAKGKMTANGREIPFTAKYSMAARDKFKIEAQGENDGNQVKIIRAVDGDKGWYIFNENEGEVDEDRLLDAKQEAFMAWVTLVAPLRGKDVQIKALGESMVDGVAASGVGVTAKGLKEVQLFFDKASGLLIKTQGQVRDMQGNESKQENCYSEFKEMDGIKRPTKFVSKRDGKPYIESTLSDFKVREKLDDKTFKKP